ncbi:AAA family ATPase [Paraburkholderia sp. DHOC27]|uniref:AAA family ATPase n=1 Tax=Paraburkholderia sp. DHOC27 TaxID=2303330 RepID=UPI000E3BB312|nr:AAA family ATPase [Paraburkholderia sp. DHOC27]RFU46626.1 GAF domain-containing protein [Paraburkholderia sp. DHOC27]
MIELSDFRFETLCDDGEVLLSRIRRGEDARTWLTVTLPSPQPAADGQARLEHAYELRSHLDGKFATLPRALVEHAGSTALLLDDPGGTSLAALPAGTLPLGRVLLIAANLAAALGALHARGLVHKDIRPANILVNTETGSVALTGFGIASCNAIEASMGTMPDFTAGALAYLAPEQTGRMNRAVDARADLYSLGITLYEILTGRSPYRANTALEWLHCHIARTPIPLNELARDVPQQVSAIVMRLLAKAAEDRYQTAQGLEDDLRRCLAAWDRSGRIDAFPLGAHDTPERLLVPERLYGREVETVELDSAFERVMRDGKSELVLVSGYSGIGKSSLVNELRKKLRATGGRFAEGKFEQYKRDIPYATLGQAFQSLTQDILAQGEAQIADWRARFAEAVGANGQLVVALIPQLEAIIGPQPAVPELPAQEAQARFQGVLSRFIGAFADAGHPLVLFLDDLQWLDGGTLDLVQSLLATSKLPDLLVVGAYRDNEVSATHPLTRALVAIREAGVPVHEIVLRPLQFSEVARLVGGALRIEPANVMHLAHFIFEKTGGNPFFTVQFLKMLAEQGHLTFDATRRAWQWNMTALREAQFTDSVVDLMVGKIERVPEATQSALKQFACFGNSASTAMLARASGMSEAQMPAALADAVNAGLVFRRERGYAFLHDRVQEAAYALIPAGERAAAHLRIGRMFTTNAAAEDIEQNIFEVVNQYNRAVELIDTPAEQMRVAQWNLLAGRRAKASSAYASAATYLALGSGLLDDASWDEHYGLKFALESSLAECEFLTGKTDSAKTRLEGLAQRARTLPDRAAIAWLRVTLFTALDQSDLAVQICLDYLRGVGIDWVPHPTRDAARAEYERLLARIGDAPIASLLDLPLLTDRDRRATLDVLTAVLPPAFFSDESLVCLILCRMANLSLEHGNSDASSIGYTYLGMVAGPVFGDYEAGYQFGQLGLALVDERRLERFRPRVYMCFAYHVVPWTKHIRTGLPLLRRAFDAASESGDLTYTGFSSCCLVTSLLAAGDPLIDVERVAQQRLGVVQAAKFGLIVDIIGAQLQLIRALRGLTSTFASFNDEAFDETRFEQHLEADPCLAIANCWYWIRKLQGRYLAGHIAEAIAAAEKAAPLLWTSSGHFEYAEYYFYAALARARQYDDATVDQQPAVLQALTEHHAKLVVWAEHCPSNFACRGALVAGEIARINGQEFEAMRQYENAIALAREHELPLVEALAHEVAGRFYLAREFTTIAFVYLGNARLAYLRWGASGKVQALDRRYPSLVRQPGEMPARSIMAEQLDVETVVKASQAISGEIAFEKLIRTLMTIMLEHAGAGRALLVLPRGEQLRIEAEALTSREGIEVRLRNEVVSARDLPVSILHASMRNQERVLLDDASLPHSFSTDEYFHSVGVRAVLCLPLVKQARLMGMLYLENDLAPGVFTPPRLAVLELLASQAAISLENASLEEKEALLEEKEALLHEVHHRVKNNLQLISSLLNLQAARVTDKAVAELFADSRNRVRSMALVHENLYRAGNFARIMMATHVNNLCGHLARAYDMGRMGVALQIDVDDVQLDMNRAVSCGLIINELVSNALKHAFPDGRSGRLRVELGLIDQERCKLTVADNGVGIAPEFSLEKADSLGLQLVHDLTHQLQGSLELSRVGGTTCSILFNAYGRG